MHLTNVDDLDPNYSDILVFFNANGGTLTFTDAALNGQAYQLHPVQQSSIDPVVRTAAFDSAGNGFSLPGRTTAVFVLKKAVQPTAAATAIPATLAAPTVVATVVPATTGTGLPVTLIIGILLVLVLVIGVGIVAFRRRPK
jgi:hypothetical protein